MRNKDTTRKNDKKAVRSTAPAVVATPTPESELSYEDMLSELEAIVNEADTRLAEEAALW